MQTPTPNSSQSGTPVESKSNMSTPISAPSPTPAKRKFCDVPTVTLVVGENKRSFHIHVDLLCDASAFFKAAFTGRFKESSDKTMQLPEDDEDTFELFVDWLYHLRYEMLPGSGPDDDDDDSEDGDGETDDDDDESGKDDQRYLQAIRLFVLADKYRICKLKSLVIERLFAAAGEFNTKGPTYVPLAYAYKNTTQGSGLRKLLVDFYTWRTDLRWYRFKAVKAFLQRHSDVAIDLLLNLAKHLEGDRDFYNPFEGDMPEEYKDEESGQES